MNFLRRPPRRIPNKLRQLRPPNGSREPPRPRQFTHNSQLLLTSPATPRPQLPFLHPPSHRLPLRSRNGQWHLARLITTEQKKYIKDQLKLGGKYTLYGWAGLLLISIISFGWHEEKLERHFPSPPDYTWWSRVLYRSALEEEDPEWTQGGVTDWSMAGSRWQKLVKRLEDPNIDGKGLVEQEEGAILIPGVGKAGYNIESKPWAWRKGYYDALMGLARVAERLDGWLRDDRNLAFPPENVIGPSNHNPRPVAPNQHSAPLEENCRPAWDPPETYYMKILTTKGFTTKQRVTAALAYADWLDYKQLPESAEAMYQWALDIACSSAFPHPSSDTTPIVDLKTGVIRENAPIVTPNSVLASTNLAIHYARNNKTSFALPIFLSVLRARRAAPSSPASPVRTDVTSDSGGFTSLVRNIFSLSKFPPLGPSGDEPLTRSPASQCDEAGIMTYIGEILFASSPTSSSTSAISASASSTQTDGLSWTRSAVDLAEASLMDSSLKPAERKACQTCLDVSLNNWMKMVGKLAKEERKAREERKRKGIEARATKKGLFGWGGGEEPEVEEHGEGRWMAEERVVERRMAETRALLLQQRFRNMGTALFGPG